jgi:cell division protein FtsX
MNTRALRYATEEAALSLWRGRQAGILSTLTIALALFVLGGFLLVTANLDRLGTEWSRAAELSVYLKDEVTAEQRRAVEAALAPGDVVASHEYVSKSDALLRFKQTFSDLAPAHCSRWRCSGWRTWRCARATWCRSPPRSTSRPSISCRRSCVCCS